MEFNAEFNVKEVFDLTDGFQSRILDVCMARNDIAYINSLIDENSDDTYFRKLFLFRQQIAMIREALHLVYLLFSEHSAQFNELSNMDLLHEKYKELSSYVDDFNVGTGTITTEFFAPVRNTISHYKDDAKKPQYSNVANQEIVGTITYSNYASAANNYGRTYAFAEAVFYRSTMKKWKEYRKLEDDDLGCLFRDFVLQYREIVVKTIQLLDEIFDKYSEKHLDIEQTSNGYRVVKKTK